MKKLILILIIITVGSVVPSLVYIINRTSSWETVLAEDPDFMCGFTDDPRADVIVSEMTFTNFTYFTCNLTLVFQQSPRLYIFPWNNHLTPHGEGTGKWGPDTLPHQELWAPADCVLTASSEWIEEHLNEKERGFINSIEIVNDSNINMYFSDTHYSQIGHIAMPVSSWEAIRDNGYISFKAGEVFGYDMNMGVGHDWVFSDKTVDHGANPYNCEPTDSLVCPYYYFNRSLKEEFDALYYGIQYPWMQSQGKYPWGNATNPKNINEENLFWGLWYYWDGVYGDMTKYPYHEYGSRIPHRYLTFKGMHICDKSTFYRRVFNWTHDVPLDPAVKGIFRDAEKEDAVEDYGYRYIFRESGDNVSGVIRLEDEPAWELPHNETKNVWLKYEVTANGPGQLDDELKVIFAHSNESAHSADLNSENAMRYMHFPHVNLTIETQVRPDIEPVILIVCMIPLFIMIIVDIIYFRKIRSS